MKVCCFVMKNHELIEVDPKKVTAVAMTTMALSSGNPVSAAQINVKEAVQPLVDVVIDLAEPITYAAMVKGGLQMAMGNEHEGKKAIGNAFKGYLVAKLVPIIFDIIDGIALVG